MGKYDPIQGDDDERQDGNILNALTTFPVQYSFNIVGKTSGDNNAVDQFVNQVKDAVIGVTGDQDGLECQIKPRGKNYTKVSVEVKVESATMIAAAYDAIEALEMTVMRF